MKSNKIKVLIIVLLSVFFVTGCTTQLQDSNNKPVRNPATGQTLTKNILCQPEDKETRDLYIKYNIDIEELPVCKNYKISDSKYDNLWSLLIVKPLAWVIIQFGNILSNYGLGLIITSLLIRLIAFPLTRKTAIQSELMKQAKPKLDKLEKKYEGKNDQESLMKKNREMMMIYQEYHINPVSGCLFAFIQTKHAN